MKLLSTYLNFLNEQQFGQPPENPPQNRRPKHYYPGKPRQVAGKPQNPLPPGEKERQPVSNTNPPEDNKGIPSPKNYFNYMVWTAKVLKQGETFRNQCYGENCGQFAVGTGDRRICKDRCDIETCKRVIQLLQASVGKCKDSMNPAQCKRRYEMLIPLYREKLNKISKKFLTNQKQQKRAEVKVG